MKKWMIFVAGIVVGVILSIIALLIFATSDKYEVKIEDEYGITMFEEPGDIVKDSSFEVFQVVKKNAALVNGSSDILDLYTGIIYLLINKEGKFYYDKEIVKVPEGKVARQIGIFQYETKDGMEKTVPVIRIMDK